MSRYRSRSKERHIDENIERLMVDMDYFKHQKNKDESNDDKSK